MDDVDGIVEAWNRERPDLDVRPLSVLSRVTRLARHLDQARTSAFAQHDLEGWEFDVLAALRRSGTPYALSPGQLATQTMVTSGTMTNRIDRLEAEPSSSVNPTRPTGVGCAWNSPTLVASPSMEPSPICCPTSNSCWSH